MTKAEYIKRLSAALSRVNKAERDKYIAYYSELIDDRMEEGLSEEAAVAGLESVESAARRILAEAQAQGNMKKGLSAGAIVAIVLGSLFVLFVVYTLLGLFTWNNVTRIGSTETHLPATNAPIASMVPGSDYVLYEATFPSEGQSFDLELIVSHIEIKPSDDNDFHLTYYVGEDYPLELAEKNGSVTLIDPRRNVYNDIELSNLFSVRTAKKTEHIVTLQVPAGASGELNLATVSGSVTLNRISISNDLNIANVSGDITMDTLECRGLFIATVSGELDIINSTADSIDAAGTSGSVELDSVTAGKINVATVSGEVDVERCTFTALYCNTVSGDLDGSLLGSPDDYRVSFASLSGRNSLAGLAGKGSIFIEFASVSGSVDLEFGD